MTSTPWKMGVVLLVGFFLASCSDAQHFLRLNNLTEIASKESSWSGPAEECTVEYLKYSLQKQKQFLKELLIIRMENYYMKKERTL